VAGKPVPSMVLIVKVPAAVIGIAVAQVFCAKVKPLTANKKNKNVIFFMFFNYKVGLILWTILK
jgi:hypothetical protein